MLTEAFIGPPAPTSSPGVNATRQLALASGLIAFTNHSQECTSPTRSPTDRPTRPAIARHGRLAARRGARIAVAAPRGAMRAARLPRGGRSTVTTGRGLAKRSSANPQSDRVRAGGVLRFADRPARSSSGQLALDEAKLTLIDHGYTFALPGDILNYTELVAARHRHGAAALLEEERDALDRLLADANLLGITSFLLPDRAQALADRARRIRARTRSSKPASSDKDCEPPGTIERPS